MIPQLLSSSAATPGRASPGMDSGQDPPAGDAETRAFTLAAQDQAIGADGRDVLASTVELAAPPVPISIAGRQADAPEPVAGRGQDAPRTGIGPAVLLAAHGRAAPDTGFRADAPPDTIRPTTTEEAEQTAPLRPTGTATPAARGGAARPASEPSSAEIPGGEAATRATGGPPGAAPSTTPTVQGAARLADGTAPAPASHGVPSAGLRPVTGASANGPPERSTDTARGRSYARAGDPGPDDKAVDPARGGQGAGPGAVTAVTATEPGTMPPERTASAEDTLTGPRETDLARAETGRTDAARPDPPRTDLARTVGHQLVEAVRHGANGSTDVALNPEELGRVRLNLTAQDGVLHVSVLAERPETQDLLRRNIGLLQSDFRALGYTDVAFDFGPGEDRPDRSPNTPPDTAQPDTAPADAIGDAMAAGADTPAETPHRIAASARLDLRL